MIGLLGLGRHKRLRGLLSPYVDGETGPAEGALVVRHLAQCRECRQELDSLRATVGLLKRLPELQIPRAFTLAVEPAELPRPASLVWASGFATSLAAVLLVALLLGDVFEVVAQSQHRGPAVADQQLESLVPERGLAAPVAPEAAPAPEAALAQAPDAAAALAAPAPPEDQDEAVEAPAPLDAAAQVKESTDKQEPPVEVSVAAAALAAPAPPEDQDEAVEAPAPSAAAAPVVESADKQEPPVEVSVSAAALAAPAPPEVQEEAVEAPAPLAAAARVKEYADEQKPPAGEAAVVSQMAVPEEAPPPVVVVPRATPVPPIGADSVPLGEESAGLGIPLWQLEVAAASAAVVLLLATTWLAWRRQRRSR